MEYNILHRRVGKMNTKYYNETKILDRENELRNKGFSESLIELILEKYRQKLEGNNNGS
jgi:hypothetical protein